MNLLENSQIFEPSDLRIPLTYWARHLKIALRYGDRKKILYLGKALLHYIKGSPKISTMPAFLKVEISRSCSVKCRYCFEEKADIFYPFALYKDLIDKLKDYIFEVSLYDIGEPLLNENILDYIKYTHSKRVGSII